MLFPRFLPLAIGLLVACGAGSSGPRLDARWVGRDSGLLAARPRAVWCAPARRLDITGMQGDNGLAFAIYPVGELGQGEYPAFLPGPDSEPPRPGAAVALRVYTTVALRGYRSDSGGGTVSLSRSGPGWSLRFALRLRQLGTLDTVRLSGLATGLAPLSDSTACGSDSLSGRKTAG
jgi:hypothetical protein